MNRDLISFLSNDSIGKKTEASNQRTFLDRITTPPPSHKIILVWKFIKNLSYPFLSSPGCLSKLTFFRCPAFFFFTNNLSTKANPQQLKTNQSTVLATSKHGSVISFSLVVISLQIENHPTSTAWSITPDDVPCFLNVEPIQEAERHDGWLMAASHLWEKPSSCLPTEMFNPNV